MSEIGDRCVHERFFIASSLKINQDLIMEVADSAVEVKKSKRILWDYVLEPVNKATYWDHAALPSEERRVQAKRSFLVVGPTDQVRRSGKREKDVEEDVFQNRTSESAVLLLESASGQGDRKGVRCAERGGSEMMLWQHEFYFVLEREEISGRKKTPPKPYLYQALQFRKGSDLPEEEKQGMTRKQLGGMFV
jgi:hypothetical protein